MNFKLLLKWNHCTANCPQKEREISFCYFTCICVCEAILYLKTKRHSKYTCSHDTSHFRSCINNSNEIYRGGKSFLISPLVEAFSLLSSRVMGGVMSALPHLTGSFQPLSAQLQKFQISWSGQNKTSLPLPRKCVKTKQ